MRALYHITKDFAELAESIMEQGAEITPEQEQALKITETELKEKSVNYAYFIKSLEDNNTIIDAEIKRLQAIKKSNEKIVEKLTDNLTNAMVLFGHDKIETPTIKLSIRKSESVEVEDVNQLDKEYKVIKVTEQADKVKIKAAIKSGEVVNGAKLVVNNNLSIK